MLSVNMSTAEQQFGKDKAKEHSTAQNNVSSHPATKTASLQEGARFTSTTGANFIVGSASAWALSLSLPTPALALMLCATLLAWPSILGPMRQLSETLSSAQPPRENILGFAWRRLGAGAASDGRRVGGACLDHSTLCCTLLR